MTYRCDLIRAHSLPEIQTELVRVLEGHYSDVFPASRDAKVLLKPNLNSNMNALTGNTTDLRILSALVAYLKEKGYSKITIGEGTNSGFYRSRIGVISRLKVDALARYYGVEVKDFNYAQPTPVRFEGGVVAQAAADCLEADLFINLPKLKTHFEVGMTVCLKNMIGCLVGQENKKKTHASLAANILNLNTVLKPHLHIVDGLIAMEGLGPTRGTPIRLDTLIVGTDPFLIDLLCCRVAGFDYRRVTTLAEAERRSLIAQGCHQFLDSLDLAGFAVHFKPPKAGPIASFIHHPRRQKYFLAVRGTPLFTYLASTQWFGKLLFLTGLRQDVFSREEMVFQGLSIDSSCDSCGLCRDYCPLGNDPSRLHKAGAPPQACIGCLYCYMICPRCAVHLDGDLGFLAEQFRQYDCLIRTLHTDGGEK